MSLFLLYIKKRQLRVCTVREMSVGNLVIHREFCLYIPYPALKDTDYDTVA